MKKSCILIFLFPIYAFGQTFTVWPGGIHQNVAGDFGEFRPSHFHGGIDIPGPQGDPIVAAGPGTITNTQFISGYGNIIEVQHSDTLFTEYAHCVSFAMDADGNTISGAVSAGQTIAYIGNTGLGAKAGTHLHFEVRNDKVTRFNPLNGYIQLQVPDSIRPIIETNNSYIFKPNDSNSWMGALGVTLTSDTVNGVTTSLPSPVTYVLNVSQDWRIGVEKIVTG